MIKSKSHIGWNFVFCVILLLVKDSFTQDAREQINYQEEATTLDSILVPNFVNSIGSTEKTTLLNNIESVVENSQISDVDEFTSSTDKSPFDEILSIFNNDDDVTTTVSNDVLQENSEENVLPVDENPTMMTEMQNNDTKMFQEDSLKADNLSTPLEPKSEQETFEKLDGRVLMNRFGLADRTLSRKPITSTLNPALDVFSSSTFDTWKPVWPFPQIKSLSIKPTIRFPSMSIPITKLEPTKIIPKKKFSISKEPVTAYYFDLSSIAPGSVNGPLYDPENLPSSISEFPFPDEMLDFSRLQPSQNDNVQSPDRRIPTIVEATPVFKLSTALRTSPTQLFQQFEASNNPSTSLQTSTVPVVIDDPAEFPSIYDWTSPRIKQLPVVYTLANSSDFQFDDSSEHKSVSNFDIDFNNKSSTSYPEITFEETTLAAGDLLNNSQPFVNASLSFNNSNVSNTTDKSSTNTTSTLSRIPLWQRISNKISTQSSITTSLNETSSPITPSSSHYPFEDNIPIGIFSPSIIKSTDKNGSKDINKSKISLSDNKISSDGPLLESSLLSTTTSQILIKPIPSHFETKVDNELDTSIDSSIRHDESANKKFFSTPIHALDTNKNEVFPTVSVNTFEITDVPFTTSDSLIDNVNNLIAHVASTHLPAPAVGVPQPSENSSLDDSDFISLTEEDALKEQYPNFIFAATIQPTPLLPYDEGKYSNYDFGDRSTSSKPFGHFTPSSKHLTPETEISTINSRKNEVYEMDDDEGSKHGENKSVSKSSPSYENDEEFRSEVADKPSTALDTEVSYTINDTDPDNLDHVVVFPLSNPSAPKIRNDTEISRPNATSVVPSEGDSSKISIIESPTLPNDNKLPTTTVKMSPTTTTTTERSTTQNFEDVVTIIENTGLGPTIHIVTKHPNGTNSTHPGPFVKAAVAYDVRQFCHHRSKIHALLREWINVHTNKTEGRLYEIKVFHQPDCKNFYNVDGVDDDEETDEMGEKRTDLYFFVTENGTINPNVTVEFPKNPTTLEISNELVYLKRKILHLELVNSSPYQDDLLLEEAAVGTSIIVIVIVTSLLLALLLASFLVFFVIKKRKTAETMHGRRCTPANDAYSLDSVSMFYHSMRRKSRKRASNKSLKSYLNQGYDGPSYPLTFAKLTHHISDNEGIHEEYSKIPSVTVKYDEMPRGVEDKNRYANVIPVSETRILLNNTTPYNEYINANSVHGPRGEMRYYIATQAPLDDTVNDFWQMIWEQECKIIVMLTDFVEKGIDKCADYLPPSETLDCHRVYGNFQITLKSRDLRDKYVVSIVQIKNLENNLIREIAHMWFTGWPHAGVPMEEKNFISFIFDVRTTRKQLRAKGPIVVHCSPGTGRTGTYIACDLTMRQFDEQKVIDVPKTVFKIRRERAGSVQTKDQYAFIYRVVNLYAAKLTTGNLDSF